MHDRGTDGEGTRPGGPAQGSAERGAHPVPAVIYRAPALPLQLTSAAHFSRLCLFFNFIYLFIYYFLKKLRVWERPGKDLGADSLLLNAVGAGVQYSSRTPALPRGGGCPAPVSAGKDSHGARADAFPTRFPSCQEISPLQEIRLARHLPPVRPLAPPSSLPTPTQPRQTHSHTTSQLGAQLRFQQQQSHQNGFVWRKV